MSQALQQMTVNELVERFTTITLAQDQAERAGKIKTYNRLFDGMTEVVMELKSRAGDQRVALTRLFDYPNWQVQLHAAINSLAVAPVVARAVIQRAADSNHFPQAMSAGSTLENLDSGFFKPV